MSIPVIDDPRGFVFTINQEKAPVYQVDSTQWARSEHRRPAAEIPPEIRAKVAELRDSGEPGAFARFGETELGVYVLCEPNIKNLPEPAAEDAVIGHSPEGPPLSPHDIVIYAKAGAIQGEDGNVYHTGEGEYYVVKGEEWSRFAPAALPPDVGTTKEVLLLLDRLHGKNFLSMSPDKPEELLCDPTDPGFNITCYVLNLSRFKR